MEIFLKYTLKILDKMDFQIYFEKVLDKMGKMELFSKYTLKSTG